MTYIIKYFENNMRLVSLGITLFFADKFKKILWTLDGGICSSIKFNCFVLRVILSMKFLR